ncbi:MAG: hypothetical protein QOJ58_4124, partial [Alphaproteobacteria bacterium]|nr:hypothetical protein [Alphaproteobacteria bacterium]
DKVSIDQANGDDDLPKGKKAANARRTEKQPCGPVVPAI